MQEIVFICTGNTCRSPMAEGIMKAMVNDERVKISSGGISAMTGDSAAENAVIALKEIGIDISGHRSRKFIKEKYSDDAVFVTMGMGHTLALIQNDIDESNIITLNVPDPFGQDIKVYRKTRDALKSSIEEILKKLGITTDGR